MLPSDVAENLNLIPQELITDLCIFQVHYFYFILLHYFYLQMDTLLHKFQEWAMAPRRYQGCRRQYAQSQSQVKMCETYWFQIQDC